MVELIRRKRDGGRLEGDEIEWLVNAYVADLVPDYQMAAFLMAVYFSGLDRQELGRLTAAMVASGERLDLDGLALPTVDKHSTGGVGDKVSLVLAPLLVSVGACVPQLSGRGLGHTGGTLDKLEAIPGFRSDLSASEVRGVLERVGCVICAAGPGLAPADRKLYALRDVTATVESIPLIASSIMSKKLAEGTSALVLDVKVGSGAFMPDLDRARQLAETMVAIGTEHGLRTTAILTRMDEPLGRAVGNGVEVEESLATLSGAGPDDLVEVTVALAVEMATLAGLEVAASADPPAALRAALAGGGALSVFREMVRAQTGDPDAPLPSAACHRLFTAEASGFVRSMDARRVGVAAWLLGAGRAKKEDPVSPSAGVICLRKPGDAVRAGDPVLELRADDPALFGPALEQLGGAVEIGPEPPASRPLVLEVIRP
ncbi:MAG TPA: thymidine phosphorylase [Acidimicrobiales bacterium]|nr:thymidine phosphorylase [Acidimicrobiales bacterium]